MSNDESSGSSSSDGEDITTTGLIATRAKRSTAGNYYESLRQILDDEELQKELLGEEEDDQGDFVGSDKDDDDAMSSSSDEDDTGPPREGDKEELEGEKELKKQERLALKRKRKMEEAKMRLPAFQKKKKVKLANDAKTGDGSVMPVAKPKKKKSERQNWLPTEADMPVRQSSRATAVANREMVHTNLKESVARSEKQKKVMANHAAKVKSTARAVLTQEERIAKTAKIEKETAKEFGRWEREEAERQRLREEALAAKRQRGIDGPVIRYWSGSVLWEGDTIKDNRLHGSQNVADVEPEPASAEGASVDEDTIVVGTHNTVEPATASDTGILPSVPATPGFAGSRPLQMAVATPPPVAGPSSWLEGIHEYANGSETTTPGLPSAYMPSTPAINTPTHGLNGLPALAPQPSSNHYTPNQSSVYHALPPVSTYGSFQLNAPIQQAPAVPAAPLIRQQAQRSLIMLEAFANLDAPPPKRNTAKSSKETSIDPTPVASILLPSSYPTFTSDEARYLTHKKKSTAKDPMPPRPAKVRCALTPFTAKFRDPKTGLAYAGLMEYKMIQRLLAGGCQWSSVLGCWVGPTYGDLGRPARGVPESFSRPVEGKGKGRDLEGEAPG